MIWVIIFGIICTAGWIAWTISEGSYMGYLFTGFMGGIIAVLAFVSGVAAASGIVEAFNAGQNEFSADYELKTIADSTLTSGSYALLSGYYQENPAFFYYFKAPNGLWQHGVTYADGNAYVEEKPGATKATLAERGSCTDTTWSVFGDCDIVSNFTVPEGTIVSELELNTGAQ